VTFDEQLNETLVAVREVRLHAKSDDELVEMLKLIHLWRVSQQAPGALVAIAAIENEMTLRRERERAKSEDVRHQEAVALNRQTIAESRRANRLSVGANWV
jgi:hypothetical protein